MDTDEILYRYTSGGKGIFMAGDELEPPELEPAINRAKAWLPTPKLECEAEFSIVRRRCKRCISGSRPKSALDL